MGCVVERVVWWLIRYVEGEEWTHDVHSAMSGKWCWLRRGNSVHGRRRDGTMCGIFGRAACSSG